MLLDNEIMNDAVDTSDSPVITEIFLIVENGKIFTVSQTKEQITNIDTLISQLEDLQHKKQNAMDIFDEQIMNLQSKIDLMKNSKG